MQDLTSSEMAALYCLAHLVARHDGRKFVTKAAAIRAWRVVLRGRFRRLEDWCTFVAAAPTAMISEDLWRQVLPSCTDCLCRNNACSTGELAAES